MIDKLVQTVDLERRTEAEAKKAEDSTLAQLKKLELYRQYLNCKASRLAVAKEARAAEDDLRQALIDNERIDGDNRHPVVKAVTRRATYTYETRDAVEWAMENDLTQYLTIDPAKFNAYLAHLADIGETLPTFAWADESVSVALISDFHAII